jgi:uncharacterized protein YbdZ (MbtH family)
MATMHQDDQEDTTLYKVVVNHEEQYSIWPAERENPLGWREVGKRGLKQECLHYIEEVWVDMRPLSLRKQMEEAAQRPSPTPASVLPGHEPPSTPGRTGDDLVDRLCEGEHPVEVSLRPPKTVQYLQESIDRGYVHIKFTDTQGGTELGVRLDPDRSNCTQANFENHTGMVHLVGELTLNYVKVRCIADIELTTLTGQGHLEPVADAFQ